MLQQGQRIRLVANPKGRVGAAFDRLKKGVIAEYQVTWVSYDKTRCDARYINEKGHLTTSYWCFNKEEVLPSAIFNKKLDDYA